MRGLRGRKARTMVAVAGYRVMTARECGCGCSAGKLEAFPVADDRHLEDMTEKYPDVCRLVLTLLERPMPDTPTPFPSTASIPSERVLDMLKSRSITSFIIDAEIVAVDKDTGAYRTFQDLSNRAKKDVQVEDIKVIVGVFAFDLMLLNDSVSRIIALC